MRWLGAVPEGQEEEADVATRSGIAAAVLVILGELAFGAVGVQLLGVTDLTLLRLGHVVFSAIILGVLLVLRQRPSVRLGTIAVTVLTLPLLPIFWIAEAEIADASLVWAPFVGHKLAVMGLAVLMPGPPLAGILLISAFGGLALAQWAVFDGHNPMAVVAGEPWITLIYVMMAWGLLVFRGHHRQIARRYARTRAEAEAFAEIARFLLALRDRSNTPIQNLEIDTAILERRFPEARDAVRRMRSAVAKLRDVSGVLARYDNLSRWEGGEESLDPAEVMRWLERARSRPPPGASAPGEEPRPESR